MYRKFIAISIILMLIITNIAIADELFLKGNNIPSLKRDFPTDPDKFTFAIIGDKTGGGEKNWGIFDRAIDEINLLNPDFAITIGDHIQGYTTDFAVLKKMWDEYYLHLSTLKMPVILVPGNHDISNTDMFIYWQGRNGKTYYSFDYKGRHFIAINTEESNSLEGANVAEKALTDFVIKDIQQNKNAKHIFVFMHKPLWIENKKIWDQIEAELKGTNYSVFAGHYHHLTQDMRNNHNYIILGATGAGLDEHSDIPQLGMYHHFTVVSVEGKDANVAIIQPGKI
ncbi:MAG: metallophosphoesterase, partial [Candidatus Poribacteria bacterium]